jgi:hypothetical protein
MQIMLSRLSESTSILNNSLHLKINASPLPWCLLFMNPLKINSPSNSLGIIPLITLSYKIKHSQTHKKGSPNHFFKPIHKLSHSKKSSSSNKFFKGKISRPMLSSSGKCFPQPPKNISPTFKRATAFLSRAITKKST